MKHDPLNRKILKCLQTNARQSNAEIGRQVGLTSPAVNERIKKMEDAGIITGYYANVWLSIKSNYYPSCIYG